MIVFDTFMIVLKCLRYLCCRIHEAIMRQNARNVDSSCGQLKSLLLDIDNRFVSIQKHVFTVLNFLKYNIP